MREKAPLFVTLVPCPDLSEYLHVSARSSFGTADKCNASRRAFSVASDRLLCLRAGSPIEGWVVIGIFDALAVAIGSACAYGGGRHVLFLLQPLNL